MKFILLYLFVALSTTSSNCQYDIYAHHYRVPSVQPPPIKIPGQWNIEQSYENYNNNPGNPGNQYSGFNTDSFYNPNFPKNPSVPERKTYKNYNMNANYHVNSKDDPTLSKDPYKSYQSTHENLMFQSNITQEFEQHDGCNSNCNDEPRKI